MRLRSIALGLTVLLLLNASGLANALLGSAYRAGELDPVLAPLVLALLAAAYLMSGLPARLIADHGPLVMIAAGLGIVALASGVLAGELLKLLRDLVYLWILCLASLNLSTWAAAGRIDIRSTASSLLIGGLIFFPVAGYLAYGLNETGRLAGFMLSPSLFGSSIAIYLLLAYLTELRGRWFGAATILGLLLILASGTRTAVLLLIALGTLHTARSIRLGRFRAAAAVPLGLGCAGAATAALLITQDVGIPTNLRVLSLQDVEAGSIASRLFWYRAVWTGLRTDGFLGGFGPGASEALLGYLPHFDLLRYWFDYSALYVLGVLLIAYHAMREPGTVRDRTWWYPCFLRALGIGILVLMSMHNILQSSGGTLLMAIFLFAIRQRLARDASIGVTPAARDAFGAQPILRQAP